VAKSFHIILKSIVSSAMSLGFDVCVYDGIPASCGSGTHSHEVHLGFKTSVTALLFLRHLFA